MIIDWQYERFWYTEDACRASGSVPVKGAIWRRDPLSISWWPVLLVTSLTGHDGGENSSSQPGYAVAKHTVEGVSVYCCARVEGVIVQHLSSFIADWCWCVL